MALYQIDGKVYEADDETGAWKQAGYDQPPGTSVGGKIGELGRMAGSAFVGVGKTALRAANKLGVDTTAGDERMALVEKAGYNEPVGNFLGEQIALAPVGAVGKGVQAAGRTFQALSRAGGAATLPAKVLRLTGAALQSPAARNIAEGATVGGLLADDTAGGAKEGAAWGAALSAAPVVRRVLAKGAVKTNPEATDAVNWVGQRTGQKMDLPLAQKASGGVAKWFYKDFLPLFPWASGALERQSEKAAGQWRRRGLQEIADAAGLGTLPGDAGNPKVIEKIVKELDDGLRQRFDDTVNQYVFNPPNMVQAVTTRAAGNKVVLKADAEDAAKFAQELVDRYTENGTLSGRAVAEIRRQLGQRGREAGGASAGQAYHEAADALLDHVEGEMVTPKTKAFFQQVAQGQIPRSSLTQDEIQAYEDFTKWESAREGWRKFLPFQRAVDKTKERKFGAFDVADLTDAVGSAIDPSRHAEMIKHGRATIAEPLKESTLAGRRMALQAASVGGLGYGAATSGVLPAVAAGATILGGARAMASPRTQKFLMGELSGQLALEQALRNYSREMQTVGRTGRNAFISDKVGEDQ